MSIAPDLAKSLSEKSDQELIGILENPGDWKPEVVDFARSELGHRSISTGQIDQKIAGNTKQKAEELQKRSIVPLTFLETFFAALDGGALGLFGLLFLWPQASRFKRQGFLLKAKKSWRIYWLAFGVRMAIVILLIAYIIILAYLFSLPFRNRASHTASMDTPSRRESEATVQCSVYLATAAELPQPCTFQDCRLPFPPM